MEHRHFVLVSCDFGNDADELTTDKHNNKFKNKFDRNKEKLKWII